MICSAFGARAILPNERLFDLTIRVAEMNDAAALAPLMCELGYGTTKSEMQMRLQRIATDERYRTFVAVCGGKVCGMIGTLTYPSYEHNDLSGRIVSLVILRMMRRRGIGRALIATAEKDFAQRGIRRVALNTRLAREDAHKFYESLGYERNGWRFVKQLSGTRLIGLDMARLRVLAVTAVAVIAIAEAQAVDTPSNAAETEEVTVTGEATGSLTSVSPEESARKKTQVPGAFTVKTADDMELGRASNFEGLLQRTPGVFLQSENGAEVSKISIRGSGITSEDEPLGVMFLLDGLNFNQGDGETILEDFDVAALSYAEVFRGADAFKYGALTLGGAINFVPFTGYNAAPFQVRLEGGSYGFFRGDMSGGAVQGKFDEFGAIGFRSLEGFREHSREDTEILFADLGYKLTTKWRIDFILRWTRPIGICLAV